MIKGEWYVSNVSVIFDSSMLLSYLFWMFMGFIIHFYIIFGTNLLTGGPVQVAVFAYFSVSPKRNIKRNPNGMKPSGELFLKRKQSRRLGVYVREATRWPSGREARPPTSCLPGWCLDVGSKSSGSRSFRKSRSRRFHSVWTLFDILFCETLR